MRAEFSLHFKVDFPAQNRKEMLSWVEALVHDVIDTFDESVTNVDLLNHTLVIHER
jgi:hypothetical protein